MVKYIAKFQKLVHMFSEMAPTFRARSQNFVRGLDLVILKQAIWCHLKILLKYSKWHDRLRYVSKILLKKLSMARPQLRADH